MTQASYSVLDNETLRFPRQLNNYNVNSIVSAQNVCILRNRKKYNVKEKERNRKRILLPISVLDSHLLEKRRFSRLRRSKK